MMKSSKTRKSTKRPWESYSCKTKGVVSCTIKETGLFSCREKFLFHISYVSSSLE